MHATALAADPPLCYLMPATLELILARCPAARRTGVPVWFTLDAGPNPVLLTDAAHEAGGGGAGPRVRRAGGGALRPRRRRPARRALRSAHRGDAPLGPRQALPLRGVRRPLGRERRGWPGSGRGPGRSGAPGRTARSTSSWPRVGSVGTVTPLGVRWASEPTAPFAFAARALDVVVRARARESLGLELALSPTAPARAVTSSASGARRGRWCWRRRARRASSRCVRTACAGDARPRRGAGREGERRRRGRVQRGRLPSLPPLAPRARHGGGLALARARGGGAPDVVRLGTTSLPASYAFSGQSASTAG